MGLRKGFYFLLFLNCIVLATTFTLSKSAALLCLFAFNAYVLSGILYVAVHDLREFRAVLLDEYSGDPSQTQSVLKGVLNELATSLVRSERDEFRALDKFADITAEVGHSANELNATAQDLNNNIKEQSLATSSIAAAVTEITYSTEDISSRMKGAHEAAQSSDELGRKGGDAIRSARADTEEVAAYADTTYKLLESLDEHTTTVATISSVIRSIAEQTNLLALNAAIEAARAGEHGAGFAVVAEEVRALATRSHESAEEISSNINDVQKQMAAVRESMDNVVSCTDRTVSKAQEAEQMLEEMATHSQAVTDLLYAISTATEQQSAAVREISANIESVAQLADKNSGIASESAAIASHVRDLCERAVEGRA
ncbi:MAG: methyl-accepting chemotaxis protein [Pseudohongiellaceae bacterium]|nr:methyl-accepting chemotaxis protein [Pseudohongiellaceae bacterium]